MKERILLGSPPANPHVTGTFSDPAPARVPDSRWWVAVRHSLSVAMTTAFITMAFAVVSLPFAAVFFIDRQLPATDYAKFLLFATGVGFVASILIFPVAFGFERLVMRGERVWKLLAACAPVASPVAAVLIYSAGMFKIQPSATVVQHAIDIATLLLMSFSVYWLSLWSLNAVRFGVWRVARRMSRVRRLG